MNYLFFFKKIVSFLCLQLCFGGWTQRNETSPLQLLGHVYKPCTLENLVLILLYGE